MDQGRRYRKYLFEGAPIPRRTIDRRRNEGISANNECSRISDNDNIEMIEINGIETSDVSTAESLTVVGNEGNANVESHQSSPMESRIDSAFATNYSTEVEQEATEESETVDDINPQPPMLYEEARISQAESEMLIMAFVIKHSLSEKGLENLLNLLNCHLPVPAYSSKFTFLKKFPTTEPKKNFFCKECEVNIEFGDSDELLCECEAINVKKESINNDKFFLTLSIEEKLRDLLSNSELRAQLNITKDSTSDVTSGQLYRQYEQNGIIGKDDITLQLNTDGVKVFKCSSSSMWPLFVSINELPLNTRRDNTILAGLFFGNGSPRMDTFLKPLIAELTKFHTSGFTITLLDGNEVTIRVHTIVSCVDSVARCKLTYSSQFNGEHGCLWCLNKGCRIPKGKGFCRIYMPYLGENRTTQNVLADAEEAITTKKTVNGIKGFSPLLELPVFDIVLSFTADYMHAGLLGVVSMFFGLLFDSAHSKQPWSLSKSIQVVSDDLQGIKPVSEITRLPSTLEKRGLFKAFEWHSILLYYSVVVFRKVMERKYLHHWFLLVYGFRKLLQNKITEIEISQAEQSLVKFVTLIGPLYGIEHSSFNTHLLLHMAQSVRNWGALWATSTFGFEHCNGILTRFFNGMRSVTAQIYRSYERRGNLVQNSKKVMTDNTCRAAYDLFYNLLENRKTVKNCVQTGCLTALGKGQSEIVSCHDRTVIRLTIPELPDTDYNVISYQRFIYKGTLYCSQAYQRVSKRDNSVVQLKSEQYMSILKVLEVRFNGKNYFLIYGNELVASNEFQITDDDLGISSCDFLQTVKRGVRMYSLVDKIKQKCLCMIVDDTMYVTPLANDFERD